ncbi:Hypothetical predicted protein [Olea europaea subsp. europaea]|uniref:Uncharacterized protein n=1 Tax=Olea europaea subsp. europaea TaxID=158383 RepID=A0A8S0SBG0_OLEEU|nr:Hypothetical predicted protein [Olea europaea subsp. europaea]
MYLTYMYIDSNNACRTKLGYKFPLQSDVYGSDGRKWTGQPNMEEVLSVDSENENVEDNMNVVEDEMVVRDGLTVPEVGAAMRYQ